MSRFLQFFREWITFIRRRKDWKKLLLTFMVRSCQGIRGGGRRPGSVSAKINLDYKPIEFMGQSRSAGTSWLNLQQLSEPGIKTASSSPQV